MKLFVYDPNTSKNEWNFHQVFLSLKIGRKIIKTECVSFATNNIGLKNHKK